MIAPATQSVVGPDAAYLAAVLDWLRLCFRRRAAGQADSAERKRIAARLSAAERKLAGLATTEPPPHLAALRDRLGLSPFEPSVLLLCVLLELDTDDPSLADLCAEALGDPARRRPTLALARGLFAEWDWRVLTPDSPLRFWQLLTTIQPEPLLTSALRADERIVAHAIGFDTLDERIAPLLSPLDFDAHLLVEPRRPEPHEQRQVWEAALSAVDAASGNLAGQLACQFSLNAADISRIASAAARDAGAVWQICRERARPQLDAL